MSACIPILNFEVSTDIFQPNKIVQFDVGPLHPVKIIQERRGSIWWDKNEVPLIKGLRCRNVTNNSTHFHNRSGVKCCGAVILGANSDFIDLYNNYIKLRA